MRVASERALVEALDWAAVHEVAVLVLGGGSNVVIADEGFPGLVIQIAIAGIDAREDGSTTFFDVGSGEPWDEFVARTVDAGCAGLECLSGIPGLVGGTPVQNVSVRPGSIEHDSFGSGDRQGIATPNHDRLARLRLRVSHQPLQTR